MGRGCSNVAVNVAVTVAVTPFPLQNRLTQEIIKYCQSFKDLKQTFVVSRRADQLRFRTQERVVDTVEDSVLCTELEDFKSLEEDIPKRVLWYKPLSSHSGAKKAHDWVVE